MSRLTGLVSLVVAAFVALPAAARQASPGELVDHSAFRVCADPNNLPFSNAEGQGFESEIAGLLAERLGVPVRYTWHPQTVGFVQNTLRAYLCDIVMGVASTNELVQNTNPYYRSTYVLAHRAADGERFGDLASPAMQDAKIGVIAGTPPADLLVEHDLLDQTRSYHLMVDTRFYNPGRDMIADLAAGEIDVALIWGPIAGYWASKQSEPIALVPLRSDRPGRRLDFRISMGIRHNEPDWKRELNGLIRELQPDINAILERYGVPLLDDRGALFAKRTPAGDAAQAPVVPEPEGYRTERYRAPTPATLEGATVVDTAALQQLIARGPPILIDVMSKRIEPKEQQAAWQPPPRQHLPGSAWLPNVGLGSLSPEFTAYFKGHLAALTEGDDAQPLVFYCDANCWMGYNAAKRAVRELGYRNVYWYPEGVQGWRDAGLDLVEARPEPMPEVAAAGH
ncbi:MAG TPA: quinoprotein dehydrogenase-associated putative ABC transporter substrate-binding protein [Geminicoccaceae bacterium]|nr:quinoprotein dehydrogenase-associated putative ABC transporter substrate-binding protein [Geminicoccaceae bacterium]